MATPQSFVEAEEKLLVDWDEQRVFQRSLEQRAKAPVFSFYDGPPFANGLPHYGHMLASVIKDTVTRYWTMRGYAVARTFGWDCHGLPVENEVEQQLGIKTKGGIEQLAATPAESIAQFNAACRTSVFRYQGEWRSFMRRIGRWADHANEYATLDNGYISSVWWAFSELHRKGLVYQDYRVSPYCTRCGTPLSNFEVNQGYKTVKDPAVFVKFRAVGDSDNKIIFDKPTFFVAWTTTPWTLPGNVALAVHPDVTYVAVEVGEEFLWLAKDRAASVVPGASIVAEASGSVLVGTSYQPLFDVPALRSATSYKLQAALFVTISDGSGIVHTAVMYGEDDFNLGKQVGLPQHHTVDAEGKFTADVPNWQGSYIKDPATNDAIISDLRSRNLLLGEPELTEHEYPFCYRCDSPLIYYALSSWFIKVTNIRDQLVAANKDVRWVPEHVKEGRFGKWLEGARDWAVSRSRYWGAPLPIWQCKDCQATKVVSDQTELAAYASGRNTFFLLRHGEAENNVSQTLASEREGEKYGLTELGKQQAAGAVEQLKTALANAGKTASDIRLVVSPIRRTQETAAIIQSALGLTVEQVVTDARLREIELASFDGKGYGEYEATREAGGAADVEQPGAIVRRVQECVAELNSRAAGVVYVLVTHGDPIWLLERALAGEPPVFTHQLTNGKIVAPEGYPEKAHLRSVTIPWIDLHRPYIDEVTFPCACGSTMQRVPEVFDCWFESGSMPYAQYGAHTRDTADELVSNKLIPADFIAEGLDQTRGWFYTLHVLAVALFNGSPAYRNVVVNGLILAADGKKLSKRLKNYTPPSELFSKWGVDPVRYFLLSSTAMGEDYRFSDEAVQQTFRQVVQLLWNVTEFYQLYRPADQSAPQLLSELKLVHVLDRWLADRLEAAIAEVTQAMDQYDLTRASRQLGLLVNDISTWYVRRSRERMKTGDAVSVLQGALYQVAIISAPFLPFIADRVYHAVGGAKDSVHLEDWITVEKVPSEALDSMEQVRAVAEVVHSLRSAAKIKLRQPLASVCITDMSLDGEHQQLLTEEVNVETVSPERGAGEWVEAKLGSATVALRIDMNDDLRARGLLREFTRQVNSLRREQGLTIHDKVKMVVAAPAELRALLAPYENVLQAAVQASSIDWNGSGKGVDVEIGDSKVNVELAK